MRVLERPGRQLLTRRDTLRVVTADPGITPEVHEWLPGRIGHHLLQLGDRALNRTDEVRTHEEVDVDAVMVDFGDGPQPVGDVGLEHVRERSPIFAVLGGKLGPVFQGQPDVDKVR